VVGGVGEAGFFGGRSFLPAPPPPPVDETLMSDGSQYMVFRSCIYKLIDQSVS